MKTIRHILLSVAMVGIVFTSVAQLTSNYTTVRLNEVGEYLYDWGAVQYDKDSWVIVGGGGNIISQNDGNISRATIQWTQVGTHTLEYYSLGVFRDDITVTVLPAVVQNGYVTGTRSVFSTSTNATLTLNDYQGTILRWEKRVESTISTIGSSGGQSSIIASVTSTRYFRAVVSSDGQDFYTDWYKVEYIEAPSGAGSDNYVKTIAALEDATDGTWGNAEKSTRFSYADGLGRSIQQVAKAATPSGDDLISFAAYDGNGESLKQYLPVTGSGSDYYSNTTSLLSEQAEYAGDIDRFAETELESSPRRRVIKQGAAGDSWQTDQHPVQMDYGYNEAYEVRYWNGAGMSNSTYPANSLRKVTMTDENGNRVVTYTNTRGQEVYKKVEYATDQWHETYKVYNELGQLTFIIPPEAMMNPEYEGVEGNTLVSSNTTLSSTDNTTYTVSPDNTLTLSPGFTGTPGFHAAIGNGLLNAAGMEAMVYQYRYDDKGRLIESKNPGTGWTYLVYDKADRVALTQDPNLRAKGKWAFVKYDQRGRKVYSGLYTSGSSRTSLQNSMNNEADLYESRTTTNEGYTKVVFPTSNFEILTVNYYDDYDFDRNGNADYSFDGTHFVNVATYPYIHGMATGSKTKVLGQSTWLISAYFYDEDQRILQVQSNNHLNAAVNDKMTYAYDNSGILNNLRIKITHHDGTSSRTIMKRYNYSSDGLGRLVSIEAKKPGGNWEYISEYSYDELGRLLTKSVGGGLQEMDYAYNIRGWLKSINDPSTTSDTRLFGMEMYYDESLGGLGQSGKHNGNISAIAWNGDGAQHTYAYTYDKKDRLTQARYGEGATFNLNSERYKVHNITYDANGNIKTLKREGITATGSPGTIDNLTYAYTGNQLDKVTDASNTAGFADGANGANELTYDDAGNLTADANKDITSITYNELNLVSQVNFESGATMTYLYAASGQKLRTTYNDGSTDHVTDYSGGFVFEDNVLQFYGMEEGRVVYANGSYENQYFLQDHQGNTRLVVSETMHDMTYLATMETENSSTEEALFVHMEGRHTDAAANSTAGGNEASMLNSARPLGPALLLKVFAGDFLDMSVKAKYFDNFSGTGRIGMDVLTTYVLGALAGDPVGENAAGTTPESWVGFTSSSNTTNPKAYLNWQLFDGDLNRIGGGYEDVTTAAYQNHELLKDTITITKSGYIFIYLTNETNSTLPVYFDDLTVTHSSRVVQQLDYYPFGMEMAHSWEQLPGQVANRFRYNAGSEKNAETGNYEMFYRHYDPALGRMNALDLVAAKYSSLTPYNYAFNNPINWNDPMGDDPDDDDTFSYDSWKDGYYRSIRRSNGVIGDDDLYGYSGGYGYMSGHVTPGSGNHWSDAFSNPTRDFFLMSHGDWSNKYGIDQMSGQQRADFASGIGEPAQWGYYDGFNVFHNFSGSEYIGTTTFAYGITGSGFGTNLFGQVTQYDASGKIVGGATQLWIDGNRPDANAGVGLSQGAESFIPVWGSGRDAIYWAQQGDLSRAAINGAMAISEAAGLTALARKGISMIAKGAARGVNPSSLIRTEVGRTWKVSTRNVADIMKSAKSSGIQKPIDVFRHGGKDYIINGHHRAHAAMRLGQKVPVNYLSSPGNYANVFELQMAAQRAAQSSFKVDGRMLQMLLR